MPTQPKQKTVEEEVIEEWFYVQRLVRVYESLSPYEHCQLVDNPRNTQEVCDKNMRILNSQANKVHTLTLIQSLSGINIDMFKEFITTELKSSGNYISIRLHSLQQLSQGNKVD